MRHPTDRIAHTTAFVTQVVEHWLEREIAQWVHPMKDRSDDPLQDERTLLPRSYISLPKCGMETSICLDICTFCHRSATSVTTTTLSVSRTANRASLYWFLAVSDTSADFVILLFVCLLFWVYFVVLGLCCCFVVGF